MHLIDPRPDKFNTLQRVRTGVLRTTAKGSNVLLALQDIPGVVEVLAHDSKWYEISELPLCLADKPILTVQERWEIIADLYETIKAINERQYVHCDVAPWNIMLTADLKPILVDWEQSYYIPDSDDPTAHAEDFDLYGKFGANIPKLSFRGILMWLNKEYDMSLRDDKPNMAALEARMRRGLENSSPTSYQKMSWPGKYEISGTRDCKARWRIMGLRKKLEGKTVLDLGCNFGWFTHQAVHEGAAVAVGLDSVEKYITCAVEMSELFDVPHAYFFEFDLDLLTQETLALVVDHDNFDVILCLSVWHHVVNKEAFMAALRDICQERIIFEMTRKNDPIRDPLLNCAQYSWKEWGEYLMKELPGWTVTLKGYSVDLERPIFEAVKP